MNRITLVALLLIACGDNDTNNPSPDGPAADAPPAARPRAIVVTGTFQNGQTGVLSALDLEALTVEQRLTPDGAVGEDPILRKVGNELFVVNRDDDNNVTILDATTLAVVKQISTGAGTNPQDVAVVGRKLFVPGLNTAGVVVLNRDGGAPATIDLSALDPSPDGKPDCNSAYAVGGEVYVSCGILGGTTPRGPAQIAVIDAATNDVKTTFALTTANPIGLLQQLPSGELVVPTIRFDDGSGCVERIQTGAAPKSNGCAVTNADLGGFASRIEVEPGAAPALWLVVPTTFPDAQLRRFDLDAMRLDPSITPVAQQVNDVTRCPNGDLIITDQTMAANGLRVYRGTTERTTAPLPVGLNPRSPHGLVCY